MEGIEIKNTQVRKRVEEILGKNEYYDCFDYAYLLPNGTIQVYYTIMEDDDCAVTWHYNISKKEDLEYVFGKQEEENDSSRKIRGRIQSGHLRHLW